MRNNGPVTGIERHFNDNERIISKTDLKGRISYGNRIFTEISGFTRDELIGKAHNILRHPDMPPAAFEDLWQTLKAGGNWRGMVKNRCKNGDHYWVDANVSPIHEKGVVTGYVSLRTRPTREEAERAENVYRLIREGKAGHLKVSQGRIVRKGPLGLIDAVRNVGIRGRMIAAFSAVILTGLGMAFMGVGTWATVGVLSLLIAGVGAYLLHIIVGPLRESVRFARALSAGDLEVEMRRSGRAEFAELLHALDVMRGTLNGIISEVAASAASVSSVGDHLGAQISGLSRRTEEQAASLEETASSMEQLTSTVRENAENASQASRLAEETRHSAEKGGEVVNRAVEAMNEIHAASRKIADISNVIDEIAFQTNLLALNAAVEAARAGEQGRGFAVVAGEVRNLAQRSATSAKEIKGLIDDSVLKVEDGARQVNASGQTLIDIVSGFEKVTAIVGEIAAASREQSSGIEQINKAVMQMDQMTQSNAALVGEAVSESQALKREAWELLNMTEFFRIGGDASPSSTATVRETTARPAVPVHRAVEAGDVAGEAASRRRHAAAG